MFGQKFYAVEKSRFICHWQIALNIYGAKYILFILIMVSFYGCGSKKIDWKPAPATTKRPYCVDGNTYYPLASAKDFSQKGYASWYGKKFHGCKTANGEIYNMYAMTAAHKVLPLNTVVKVENLENGRNVVVRINDRGPFVKNRIIDLSYRAAYQIGITGKGTGLVKITALSQSYMDDNGIEKYLPLSYGNFYIQVGSFENANNAWRLRGKLAKTYKKVAVYKQDGYFKVQVYGGTEYDQALIREAELEKRGFKGAFIVIR